MQKSSFDIISVYVSMIHVITSLQVSQNTEIGKRKVDSRLLDTCEVCTMMTIILCIYGWQNTSDENHVAWLREKTDEINYCVFCLHNYEVIPVREVISYKLCKLPVDCRGENFGYYCESAVRLTILIRILTASHRSSLAGARQRVGAMMRWYIHVWQQLSFAAGFMPFIH